MAKKPKAGSAKKAATKNKMTKAEQSRAFIKTARAIGVDESGKEFEQLFKQAVIRRRLQAP